MLKEHTVRIAVTLDNFYSLAESSERLALLEMYQSIDSCVVHALSMAMYLFGTYGFRVNTMLEHSEYTCYELLYDEYMDEWELSPQESEDAITSMNQMIRDMYPVVVEYARYLLGRGETFEWITENIEDSNWEVDRTDGSLPDESMEMNVFVEVITSTY